MRRALALLAVVLVVAVVAFFGAAWRYADLVDGGALRPDRGPDALDLRIVSLGEGAITLASADDPDDDWRRPGVWGLEWEGGYGRLGELLSESAGEVVRRFEPVAGQPAPGQLARIDSYAFPGDPQQAFAIPFFELNLPSEVGDLPAWFIDGPSRTWVVFVHGKDAERRQALRYLPVIHGLGLPVLVVSYRNDGLAPDGLDRRYRYGATEWRDLEAAVAFAFTHGAQRVVLFGHSLGGAIVMSFMERSAHAGQVAALVLDAPVLDLEATVDYAAERRGLPGPLTALAKWLAGRRFDVDWDNLDYLERAGRLSVPVLLFHGDADRTVPIKTSEALARARPELVTFVRVEGAGHVRSWNADPEAYEAALTGFLRRLVAAP